MLTARHAHLVQIFATMISVAVMDFKSATLGTSLVKKSMILSMLRRIILEVDNYELGLASYKRFYRSEELLREIAQLRHMLTGFPVKIFKRSFNRSFD